jgi:hypothetical protein
MLPFTSQRTRCVTSGELAVSNPPTHVAPTRTDPYRVIEEIKRLAVEQLGNLPGALYGPIEDALNAAASANAAAAQLNYQDQAALWVLRQRQASHVMRFRQEIAQAFDEFRTLRIRSRGDLPLGLIDEKQLEFHLAGERLAEAVDTHFQQALQAIDGGMRALAAVLGVPPTVNPVGGERLAAAFTETYGDEEIPAALRTRMFQQYEKELLHVLGQLYDKINVVLARNGYAVSATMTRTPAPVRPPAAPPPPPAARTEPPRPPVPPPQAQWQPPAERYEREERRDSGHYQPAPPAARSPLDPVSAAELSELRNLLHAWRDGGLQAAPVAEPPRPAPVPPGPRGGREMRVDELVSVASLLQAEPVDVFARALAGSGRLAGAIREQLNDGSRRLGLNPEDTRFSTTEEDAIDLVALLFDSLFEKHRMQERARRLYARLVLPYVKVALSDESMFVRNGHPARRLFDAITEACAGNNAETPQERELLDRASAAAQKVVAEYNEDVTIFETAYAELDALLQQQRRRIELQEDRAAKATWGRERLEHARAQADAIVARRLAAPPVSRAVADFLGTPWRHHLVQTLLREGADAGRHAEAVALGDALVTADRLASENRGGELADHLLKLQPAIIECLGSSGLDQSAAEHGMAVLVKAFAYPDTPRDLHQPPPAQATAADVAAETARWLGDGADPAELSPAPAMVERMRGLKAGQWLQLTDVHGQSSEAKVAWASPLSARRLLVNRRGLRLLVATPEQLALMAAEKRLQVTVERTAFDLALQQVRQRLDRELATRH